ncbi:MAG: UDP-N-acetylmuramoyl-L-alanyl-D-glutamate--2,6-diaminopimelate ligase, partial [Chloroflexi bacterium]
MNLFQLISHLPNYSILPSADADTEPGPDTPNITAITSDSRQVQPGALFVAYRGVAADGHRYLADAVARGAAALVVENPTLPQLNHLPPVIQVPNGREALAHLAAAWHNFPARKLAMVGITGTDGKTTTTNFLYHILKAAGQNVGMISTVNAVIGERVLDTGLHTTTPDAPDVQRFLAEMVRSGTDTCLLETTSHGLAQHRVTACDFDIAVVTNITHEHLDIHGSLAGYRAAKADLFESLATAAQKQLPKTAVLNCDDWSFDFLRPKLDSAGVRWLGYSLASHPQATVTAENAACLPHKTTFTVRGQDFA